MIKKTKLYAIMGLALIINAVICLLVFMSTYREKKQISAAFWALAVALGTTGAALMAVYAAREHIRISDLKHALSEKDHWFHSFEYPECAEPTVDIEEELFPDVETEEEEMPF